MNTKTQIQAAPSLRASVSPVLATGTGRQEVLGDVRRIEELCSQVRTDLSVKGPIDVKRVRSTLNTIKLCGRSSCSSS